MSDKTFLALVGSPRVTSTSEKLAQHLADGLGECGWSTNVQRIGPALRNANKWPVLEACYSHADVIALCLPLYVDSLPAEMTQGLERLVTLPHAAGARLLAVVNCGFLEAEHNDIALDICRLFARDAGLAWSGGLAIGGGGMLGGRAPKELGNMMAHLVSALEQTVAAVNTGQPIPPEALALARRPPCPRWLYMLMANFGMLKAAAHNHVLTRINARPYA